MSEWKTSSEPNSDCGESTKSEKQMKPHVPVQSMPLMTGGWKQTLKFIVLKSRACPFPTARGTKLAWAENSLRSR